MWHLFFCLQRVTPALSGELAAVFFCPWLRHLTQWEALLERHDGSANLAHLGCGPQTEPGITGDPKFTRFISARAAGSRSSDASSLAAFCESFTNEAEVEDCAEDSPPAHLGCHRLDEKISEHRCRSNPPWWQRSPPFPHPRRLGKPQSYRRGRGRTMCKPILPQARRRRRSSPHLWPAKQRPYLRRCCTLPCPWLRWWIPDLLPELRLHLRLRQTRVTADRRHDRLVTESLPCAHATASAVARASSCEFPSSARQAKREPDDDRSGERTACPRNGARVSRRRDRIGRDYRPPEGMSIRWILNISNF
jgi:hypothetical protein